MTLTPYGDTSRQHRKWMQSFMGSRSARQNIERVQEVEARRFLYRLLQSPQSFLDHLRLSVFMLQISSCLLT